MREHFGSWWLPLTTPVMPSDLDFENLVTLDHRDLYRFAFSMTRSESDASDSDATDLLYLGAKGDRLRDPASVKSWLFTTLHREFLQLAAATFALFRRRVERDDG